MSSMVNPILIYIIIYNIQQVASHNKLEGIKVGDKDAVIVNSVAISPSSLIYNEELVILFLESIAGTLP